ncbi:MAG: hypothetical protein PHU92_03340, partial [Candidatus Shapirobacteria bacterium]|nr:hypothetical protein [Candidatus Shapirobacteria bacterium]
MPITFEARHLSSSSRHEQTFETEFGEAQETARKVLGAVVEARSEHLQQWSSQDLFRYVEHCGQKVEQFGSEGRTYQFNLASTLFAIERANIYKHVLDYGSFTSEGEKQAFQKDWKCHLAQAQQSLSDILLSASDEKVRRLSSHLAGALLVWPPQKGGPDMEQF